ncbi:MAG: hypothetical protein E7389_04345 [Ruminococcaceae bacterium]|nr:hypothetical protein [Oscillospiraceae bacterium]
MKHKKIVSLMLSLFLLLSLFPMSISAESSTTITVQSVTATAGSTVTVPVTIQNNPGILGASLKFSYDPKLTLTNITNGSAFSALTMTKPGSLTSPCKVIWDGQDLDENDISDGTMVVLQFAVSDDAVAGETYNIRVSYDDGDFVDSDLNPIDVTTVNGAVSVISIKYGDVNDDTKINTTDIIMMRRHIAGGYSQRIIEKAADVDCNGKVNTTDVILVRRFTAGGYDVELPYIVCNHSLVEVPYKAPTTSEAGNIAYWRCSKCNKCYSDNKGEHEIRQADTIIPQLSLNEYTITYYVDSNDNYLKALEITNPNPSTYAEENGLDLSDLHVDGYNFVGWFTAQTGGTQVTQIPAGTTGNKTLYAHWEKVNFTVQLACDMVPQSPVTYTTDNGAVLPKPSLDKYTFVGWSDSQGNMWDSIPQGTTGNFTLLANWSSNRNKAEAVKTLGDPIVCEDSENGLIMFGYEIGTIKNVPLYTTLQLQCANGLISTFKVEEQDTISETNAKTVAEKIQQATTNSTAWSLSSDWNNTTQVSESYINQIGKTTEEAETCAKTTTGTYSIGTSSGGKNSTTDSSSGSYKLSKNTSHSDTTTSEDSYELTTNAKITAELSASYAGIGAKVGSELGYNEKEGYKDTQSGTDGWSKNIDTSEETSHSSLAESTWNSSSSYTNSDTVSRNTTVSSAISELVSKQYGYGSSYAIGGSNNESQTFASTDTSAKECSSSITYFNSQIATKTTSYSSTGNTHGNYRMVMAGTIHVFAVVCYDVAKQEYFVYTYNILGDGVNSDDAPKEYLDYSYDGTFEDYETSIIPFEVPYYVNQYVNSRIAVSDGLQIDVDTGIVENYIPDSSNPDSIVIIPSYVRVNNNDGTYSSVKVTGIRSSLFKNNTDIVGVSLSSFIDEIPDSAFEGCSSLREIICPNVTKIGDNAFKGCTSLSTFTLPEFTESVGNNAFEGVPSVSSVAQGTEVAQAVASCGADSITLDISAIPENEAQNMEFSIGEISTFELIGKDKEYKGLSIKSDAETTIINGVTFTENNKVPMELASQNVTLDRVTVDCTGFALALKAEETNLILNRTVNLLSHNENTVLCKNIVLSNLSSSVVGKLNVTGNVLVYGDIVGDNYLTVNDGEIIYINEDDFDNYLSAHRVSFDANGGTVNAEDKLVPLSSSFGELPKPIRDYYTFDGWYTAAEGGDLITADSIMTSLVDLTLYAHWTQNAPSEWTLASNVPADAEIVDRYYTYTLTSYTSSGSSSMSGWSPYDSSWVWSNYGGWSDWSTTNPGESDSRQREWKQGSNWVDTSYWKDTSHYEGRWRYYHWCGTRGNTDIYTYQYSSNYQFHEMSTSYELGVYRYANGSVPEYGQYDWCGRSNLWFRGGYSNDNGDYYWEQWVSSGEWVSQGYTNYYDLWRYRDRSKVYTYYFKKTQNKESASYPTYNLLSSVSESSHPNGDYMSNVQEYVQYRAK